MRFLFLLLLPLLACSRSSPWAFSQVHSEREEFRSTKLTYASHSPVNGIDLELLKTQERLTAFLNIHSIPIPPGREDPKRAMLFLTIDGKKSEHAVYRLDGGQRFVLDEETTTLLIEALKEKQDVALSLSSYRTLLKPEGFGPGFERLNHPFPLENPFRLPL